MCWGGRKPFLPGLLIGETQASSSGERGGGRGAGAGGRGREGHRKEEDTVQVLESPLFIIYHHHPRPSEHRLTHEIYTNSHCLGLCQPRGAPLWQDCHARGDRASLPALVFGIPSFLVSLPRCQLANPEPDPSRYVPVRH